MARLRAVVLVAWFTMNDDKPVVHKHRDFKLFDHLYDWQLSSKTEKEMPLL